MSSRRLLHEFPTGWRRRVYVSVVILAVFISAYEGQLAPILPLLLSDLHMPLQTYGLITAASLLVGAFAGYIGGGLVDRVGRVRILVPFSFLSAGACLFMAGSDSMLHFLIARILLAFVEGVAVAGTAPLIRDFTPRVGRAQAYALWTWGPVGASFFAAAIAALTLGAFGHSWRSQVYLMGAFACVGAVAVALVLRDLSPEVRRTVRSTEHTVHSAQHPLHERADAGGRRLRLLLQRPTVWAHVAAMALMYVFLATMNSYAQIMLVDHFALSIQLASGVAMAFWLCNLGGGILFSWLSDRVQRRKPFMLAGSAAATVLLAAFIASMTAGHQAPLALLILLLAATGLALGAVFGPWMASFSEDIEEVHPDIQGLAFGLNHLVTRLFVLASVLLAPRVVAAAGWETWMIAATVAIAGFLAVITLVPDHRRKDMRDSEAPATAAAQEAGTSLS
ncbi:MFS transporter [Sinomonas atrocyanea]|uniref:MFS transporter n=1 Tax=Sinomonas atrocyanea TaxID=37927 RepID=A0A127A2U2_9MICC|nr:MFS transporter [Sinomonas atrocyanea]AMM32915.1 MFS transporter [Sinomonas atrocyanea]GEB65036.1 hypothetical protein SAT01_24840 [Sinomonas atrocyanea]GGG61303.1 hypothetical protein GCM10007172_10450 [Sinomonas atrocyanea]